MGSLVEIARAGGGGRELPDDLEASLAARIAQARAAWPTLAVPEDRLVRAIGARLGTDEPAERALARLHIDDLCLACGCADGAPEAVVEFEARCGSVIARAIVSAGATSADRADLGQVVRQRLLVAPADGGPPRIATYSARGPLGAWVRVVATREAVRMMPRVRPGAGSADDELAFLVAPDADPEISYLRRLYRHEFKRAFHAAVAALDDRDRLVLRQHTLDGLSIDQLAALHGAHRATIARWIEAARSAILASVQRELIDRLRLSRSELASVIRLIQSGLDVSLPRILR